MNALVAPKANPQTDLPVLLADIGGTHARFAWAASVTAQPQHFKVFFCNEFPVLSEVVQIYLDQLPDHCASPQLAVFAVASVVTAPVVRMTNNPWEIDRKGLQQRFGWHRFDLLNDFEALALSLPALKEQDLRLIGGGQLRENQVKAVLGPGTGLGVAGVVPVGGQRWIALPSEGGHATLCAGNPFETEVIKAAWAYRQHISAEVFLSGMGLPSLYRAVCVVRGEQPNTDWTAQQISDQGVLEQNCASHVTMQTFCDMLGMFAGNVALTYGAFGGVYIGGGIVPKLGNFFFKTDFRNRFEAKGRFQSYLENIATPLITAEFPTFRGMMQAVSNL